jgi:hypothetical protein
MSDGNKPVYRWPWVVLLLFIFAVVLAAIWMLAEVKRMQRQRDFIYPATPVTVTNKN